MNYNTALKMTQSLHY